MALALKHRIHDDDTTLDGTPIRYLPLDHVYSATSPCRVSAGVSSNVMSKKVKARKLIANDFDLNPSSSITSSTSSLPNRPSVLRVYSRRPKRSRHSPSNPSFFRKLISRGTGDAGSEFEPEDSKADILLLNLNQAKAKKKKKRRIGSSELVKLGVDSTILRSLDRPRLRDCRIHNLNNSNNNNSNNNTNVDSNNSNLRKRKRNSASSENCEKVLSDSPTTKRWVRSVSVLLHYSFLISRTNSEFERLEYFEQVEF
jgi:hypothetical protein